MLRPRVAKVQVTRDQTRYLFTLERPDGTRALWLGLDVFNRTLARGITLDFRIFNHDGR